MASNRKPNPFNRVRWNSTRKAGVPRLFQRIVQRTVPCWIFDSNSLVAVDYDLEEWRHIQPDKNWHHMWVHKQDDHLIRNGGMSDTEIQSFRRINARAHVIVKDGETVAYSWLVPDSRHIFDWIQVILAPGELYSSGAFVAHSYRGQRLQGDQKKLAEANWPTKITAGW